MSFQTELFAPETIDEKARQLVLVLARARGWLTRREIGELTGMDDRDIRAAAAEANRGQKYLVVVRWQKGFCHRDFADPVDISRAYDQNMAQVRAQTLEAIAQKRLAHAKVEGLV